MLTTGPPPGRGGTGAAWAKDAFRFDVRCQAQQCAALGKLASTGPIVFRASVRHDAASGSVTFTFTRQIYALGHVLGDAWMSANPLSSCRCRAIDQKPNPGSPTRSQKRPV